MNVDAAKRDLPRSPLLAVVRHAGTIVAPGANKRVREWYATRISDAQHSGYAFPPDTPEIGYVVVDDSHRNNHLSTQAVVALLKDSHGPLFATADKARMKGVLARAGFVQKDAEWPGEHGQLSLWVRPADDALAATE